MGCPIHVGGRWKAPFFLLWYPSCRLLVGLPEQSPRAHALVAVHRTSTQRTVGFVIPRKHLLLMGTCLFLCPTAEDHPDTHVRGTMGPLSVRVHRTWACVGSFSGGSRKQGFALDWML